MGVQALDWDHLDVHIKHYQRRESMKCCCVIKWKDLSEHVRNLLKLFVCMIITLSSWIFVIGYNNGQVLYTGEWMFWLFWQYIFLFMLLWCFFWFLKKFSIQSDENEVFAYIYFTHLFLFTAFKIFIENTNKSRWREYCRLDEASWMFLVISPFLVILLTLGCVTISKLRKFMRIPKCCSTRPNREVRRRRLKGIKIMAFLRGMNRIFVRTVQPSEANSNNPEDGRHEAEDPTMAEEAELALLLDQPPPNYEDILLADLPNYESLNIKQFMLGHKVFIIDKSFHMTSFRVSDQV